MATVINRRSAITSTLHSQRRLSDSLHYQSFPILDSFGIESIFRRHEEESFVLYSFGIMFVFCYPPSSDFGIYNPFDVKTDFHCLSYRLGVLIPVEGGFLLAFILLLSKSSYKVTELPAFQKGLLLHVVSY